MGDLRDWSPELNGLASGEKSSSSSFLSSNQAGIAAECWLKAEEVTQGIIAQVQPTVVSEERRKTVIDYVQKLIRNYIGCEVFPFGSVPLKTYLPDGDIDLTVFGSLNFEEALANDVCSVLEREDHNKDAEFVVKDVQLIWARVFNFDFVVETPENGGGELLLSNDFLRERVEMFSVPSRGFETNSRAFPQKHLNIVDPLKENNNLGRSVSKGNFYRIRSAFIYGARKLGHILSRAEESIADELCKFFSNTLDRHGSGQRPDVQDPAPLSRFCGFRAASLVSGTESCQEDQTFCESESSNSSTITGNYRYDNVGSLHKVNKGNVSGRETNFNGTLNEPQGFANTVSVSEIRLSGDANDLATSRIQGLVISNDAYESCPPNAEDSVSSLDDVQHASHHFFCISSLDNGDVRYGNAECKQPETSGFTVKNVAFGILPATSEKMGTNMHGDHSGNQLVVSQGVRSPLGLKQHSLISNSAWSSEDLYPGYSAYSASSSAGGSQEALSSSSDLCGDYDSHLLCLNYGQWCYDYACGASIPPFSSPLLFQHHNQNSWDVVRKSVQFMRNAKNAKRQGYYP